MGVCKGRRSGTVGGSRANFWTISKGYIPPQCIIKLINQTDISQSWLRFIAKRVLLKAGKKRLECGQAQANKALHPIAFDCFISGYAGGVAHDRQVANWLDGISRQETQPSGLVETVNYCQRLTKPVTVDVQHWHQTLRVARQMGRRFLIVLQ